MVGAAFGRSTAFCGVHKVRSPDQPDAMPEAHPADARVELVGTSWGQQLRAVVSDRRPGCHTGPACPPGLLALKGHPGMQPAHRTPNPTPPRLRGTALVGRANCTPTLAASPPFPIRWPPAGRTRGTFPHRPESGNPSRPKRPGCRRESAGRITEKVFQDFFGRRGQIHDSPGKIGILAMKLLVEMRITFWSEWHLPARRG